jgi:putative hydrolase of the HAD superfamily
VEGGAVSGIRALVFDLDGTLYVSDEVGRQIDDSAMGHVAAVRGISPEEAKLLVRETREKIAARTGRTASLSHACLELGVDLRELHRHFEAEIVPEPYLQRDERVVELLQRLGERFELHIYTNNNRHLASRIMGALGIAGCFRRIFTIEDSWRPKPDRQVLAEIFREIGQEPAQCLFVGDRYDIDLRLPLELGCRVFHTRTVDELLTIETILV